MGRWEVIPLDVRENVIKVVSHVKNCMPNPPDEHFKWLFEVYNTYVEPLNCKKMTCRNDKATVLNVLNTYSEIWKNQKKSSTKQ